MASEKPESALSHYSRVSDLPLQYKMNFVRPQVQFQADFPRFLQVSRLDGDIVVSDGAVVRADRFDPKDFKAALLQCLHVLTHGFV